MESRGIILMYSWIIWAILLIVQNASFTLVSRARNSSSILYHATASLFSNGIWFLSQFIVIDKVVGLIKNPNTGLAILTALFYVIFTMVGSITMHYISMQYLEKGKRKIGAY